MSEVAETKASVRKRMNPVASVLFAMAAVFLVLELSSSLLIAPLLKHAYADPYGPPTTALAVWDEIFRSLRTAIYSVSVLTAFGALIELVDRVLWRLTPEDERIVKR